MKEKWLSSHSTVRTDCFFENGKPAKFERVCYGEIIITSRRLSAGKDDIAAAWISEIRKKGLQCLPIDEKTKSFLMRVQFYRQENRNEKLAENAGKSGGTLEEELALSAEEWLVPFMAGMNRLDAKTVHDALYWYLNGNEVDAAVPERITLQNGRTCAVHYEKNSTIRPVIEIIIQRIFGCFETPKIRKLSLFPDVSKHPAVALLYLKQENFLQRNQVFSITEQQLRLFVNFLRHIQFLKERNMQ